MTIAGLSVLKELHLMWSNSKSSRSSCAGPRFVVQVAWQVFRRRVEPPGLSSESLQAKTAAHAAMPPPSLV